MDARRGWRDVHEPASHDGRPGDRPRLALYDWNRAGHVAEGTRAVEFHDETLRDGIQGPSITDPPLAAKLALLEDAEALGLTSIDIGLPGAGPRATADCLALARHAVEQKMSVRPQCAARTLVTDIRPVADISQAIGVAVEVGVFVGVSPIRQYVEQWDLDHLRRLTATAIEFARREGLPVLYATEDTTRSRPETLALLYREAVECGARRIALCDTVGTATPHGTQALVSWMRRLVDETGEEVAIDWHGHNDRGLAVANALAAIEAGADCIHGTALGIGERVGNASLDQCLMHYARAGRIEVDRARLAAWCRRVSAVCHWPIPRAYPLDWIREA